MKRTIMILSVLLALAVVAGGCSKAEKKAAESVVLLNVSYDPTRELYREFNQLFSDRWKAEHGVTVTVEQSHGGSGKQARSVIDGLEADVVTLATAVDIDAIAARTGEIPPDWQSRLPNRNAPYYSTMVFLVRKGNPKQIHDWQDLVRPGIGVITPNPKTSGAARWNYLAARAWAMREYSGDEARVLTYLEGLYANVPVLDSGARGASNTFARAGIGDVLINWENEAFLLVEDIGSDGFEIVVPSVSVLAEPPVAVVEGVATRHGTLEIAQAYLEMLYTPQAQQMIARHHYRPSDVEVLAQYGEKFPSVELVSVEEFGGWQRAQADYFADGGEFDRVMWSVQKRP